MTTLEVLKRNKRPNYRIVGFWDDLSSLKGKAIDGVKVIGGVDALDQMKELGCQELVIAIHPKNLSVEVKTSIANKASSRKCSKQRRKNK
jgi:FlaA1/EpsC-like NDP-sugar epimerase